MSVPSPLQSATEERNSGSPVAADSKVNGASETPNLPGVIARILGQYQDMVVHEMKRDLRGVVIGEVTHEARILRYRAQERLRSTVSEFRELVQRAMDQARDYIFETLQTETDAIFDELVVRFNGLLQEAEMDSNGWSPEIPMPEEPSTPGMSSHEATEINSLPEPMKPTDAKEAPGPDDTELWKEPDEHVGSTVHHQVNGNGEVRLELAPPLDLGLLLGFFRTLAGIKEVRILQTVGSADDGVSIYVRPNQLSSLPDLLQKLPGVEIASDELEASSGKDEGDEAEKVRTLRLHLVSTDE